MPTLSDLAAQYGVSTNKPFFPVNSLRLLYFLIAGSLTNNNQDVLSQLTQLIDTVEAVFASRREHRANTPDATPQTELLAAQPALQAVYAIVHTPVAERMFEQLFTDLYPLQDELFASLSAEFNSNIPLTPAHLNVFLRLRAMDSSVFATLINEVIGKYSTTNYRPAVAYHLNQVYQLNDLVDAVVFAKDDLNAGAFSLFHVIQRIAPESNAAKELIAQKLGELVKQAGVFSFPNELQQEVTAFYQSLADVLVMKERS